MIIPKDKLIDYFNREHFKSEEKTYDEVKYTFSNNYHTCHPLLKILNARKYEERFNADLNMQFVGGNSI